MNIPSFYIVVNTFASFPADAVDGMAGYTIDTATRYHRIAGVWTADPVPIVPPHNHGTGTNNQIVLFDVGANGTIKNSSIAEIAAGKEQINGSGEVYLVLADGGFDKVWLAKQAGTNDFQLWVSGNELIHGVYATGVLKLPQLTTNGYLKTTGGDGTLTVSTTGGLSEAQIAARVTIGV